MIHPAADLVVLAGTLWLAVHAGRRGAAAYLALGAAAAGDLVAVQARATGLHPGTWSQLCWLAALALLGVTGLIRPAAAVQPAESSAVPAEPPTTTLIALAASGVAAVGLLIFGIVTWGHSGTLPLIAGGVLVLCLIGRITGLLRQAATMSVLAEQSDIQFHQLADRTSDVVLLCDAAGQISYASEAVSHYGYAPAGLARTRRGRPGSSRRPGQGAARGRGCLHRHRVSGRDAGLPRPGIRRHLAARPGHPVPVRAGEPD